MMDFAASIEKVKDHGWYWGPLSGKDWPPSLELFLKCLQASFFICCFQARLPRES